MPAGLARPGEELSLQPGLAQVPLVLEGEQTSTLTRKWLCLSASTCPELLYIPEYLLSPLIFPHNSEGCVSASFHFLTLQDNLNSLKQSTAG